MKYKFSEGVNVVIKADIFVRGRKGMLRVHSDYQKNVGAVIILLES